LNQTVLLWDVYSGSRLHFAICAMRQRIAGNATAEQQLILRCGAAQGLDAMPALPPTLRVSPHAMCYVSAHYDTGENTEEYDDWYLETHAQLLAWLG
jgi:hypothetical protein